MSLVNIVSALGDNNSVYPLLVRDCGIENVAKCALTYKQNAKESKYIAREATRERIIDEYGTSAVWLGGVPLLNKVCDTFIKKSKFAPEVNLKLFNETASQGINVNIEKFKDKLPEITEQLKKVRDNKKTFQNLQAFKFIATTSIPIALMGFLLPKLNFLYTKNKNEKKKSLITQPFEGNSSLKPSMQGFLKEIKNSKKTNNVSFSGLEKLANLSNLQKMMILDAGLTAGRVKTGRNPEEKAELGFKMLLMCYLNYLAPKNIEKLLNKPTKKIFGINTSLDVKLLNSKDFIKEIKENKLALPKGIDEKSIIDFIDQNPTSSFVKQAQKTNLVSMLKNNIRDPRKYVETGKLAEFKKAIEEFASDAVKSGSVEKFAKKALYAKSFNTIANVAISSFLLAGVLPKVQFLFRKVLTKSDLDPGVKQYDKK